MNRQKIKVLINVILNAQLNYCPLIWMLHNRQKNNKVKHLHERCLCLFHNDKMYSYKELLEKDESVSIHYKKIQRFPSGVF